MSNFLINHIASSIAKAVKPQTMPTLSQLKSERAQWIIAGKALGLCILFLMITVAVIILLLFLVMVIV